MRFERTEWIKRSVGNDEGAEDAAGKASEKMEELVVLRNVVEQAAELPEIPEHGDDCRGEKHRSDVAQAEKSEP